jgi:hypothetical protein
MQVIHASVSRPPQRLLECKEIELTSRGVVIHFENTKFNPVGRVKKMGFMQVGE